jgi:glycosyltransferase involved in cell wall biosynthesis
MFAESNIVCLPSYYGEGVPKVLIEAASCGRPIVTTDMPGCREIVHDSVNGFLVPARDPDALADALEKLIGSESLRKEFGKKGREIVIKDFSVEKVIKETLDLYGTISK